MDAPGIDVFAYIDSFLAQYDPLCPLLPCTRNIHISAKYIALPPPPPAQHQTLVVHTTKHPYWNFSADYYTADPLEIRWPDRKTAFVFSADMSSISISFDTSVPASFAGEYVFHCMRSFAIYLRETSMDTYFMHASAVQLNGKGILFIGGANAGKTTLFMKSILEHDALPLSNDRILLSVTGNGITGNSWPSYVSLCEGTILNNDKLRSAAIQYSQDHAPYKTINWDAPLKYSFSKNDKRIYPLQWLTEITGKKYLQQSPVNAIIFTSMTANGSQPVFEEMDPGNADHANYISTTLQNNSFDAEEPSFKPWHKLPFPQHPGNADTLLNKIKNTNVRILKSTIPVNRLSEAINYLNLCL